MDGLTSLRWFGWTSLQAIWASQLSEALFRVLQNQMMLEYVRLRASGYPNEIIAHDFPRQKLPSTKLALPDLRALRLDAADDYFFRCLQLPALTSLHLSTASTRLQSIDSVLTRIVSASHREMPASISNSYPKHESDPSPTSLQLYGQSVAAAKVRQ